MKKYFAEMIGTMVLVLMGCGSAVFSGGIAQTVGAGTGTLGVALAFGLAVVAMAYTIGNISGCHINPAITLGMWLSRRIGSRDAMFYMLFQVVGAILGSLILAILVATGGHDGPTMTGSNTFDSGETWQAFIAETAFTFIFVLVVLGATDEKKELATLPDWPSASHSCSSTSSASRSPALPSIRHEALAQPCLTEDKPSHNYGCSS